MSLITEPHSPSLLPDRPSSPIGYDDIPSIDSAYQTENDIADELLENDLNFQPVYNSSLQAAHSLLFQKLVENIRKIPTAPALVHYPESKTDLDSHVLLDIASKAKCLVCMDTKSADLGSKMCEVMTVMELHMNFFCTY